MYLKVPNLIRNTYTGKNSSNKITRKILWTNSISSNNNNFNNKNPTNNNNTSKSNTNTIM